MTKLKWETVEIIQEIEAVYNKYNDNFINGLFADNIPLGLLIEHMVTIQNANNNKLVYSFYKKEQLNKAWELVKFLIIERKITLLYQKKEIPFSQDTAISHLENKNFVDVLDKLVNFQSLINSIEKLHGISDHDPRLGSIRKIYLDVLNQNLHKESYRELKKSQTDRDEFFNNLSKEQLKSFEPKQRRKRNKTDLVLHLMQELNQESNKIPTSRDVWNRIKKHHEGGNHFRNNKMIKSISDDLLLWKDGSQTKFSSFKALYHERKNLFQG